MKKVTCPNCNGKGEVPNVPIYTMDNLQLAKEIHERALKKWLNGDDNNIIALSLELKGRLKKGIEEIGE